MTDDVLNSPVPPAGLRRRAVAFLVDGLVLGLLGYVLGLLFFDILVRLGPWGRGFGFAVALAYFVPQESVGGQSLGKRLLGIRVVDARGRALGHARSTARFAILGVPYFLNGAALPTSVTTLAGGVPVSMGVIGGPLALAWLLVFNRRTRQSLHDLAVGAFVVRVRKEAHGERDTPGAARAWGGHRAIAAGLIVVGGALPLLSAQLWRPPSFIGLDTLRRRLEAQPELRSASVSSVRGAVESQRRTLEIEGRVVRPLADNVPLATRLAGIALASCSGAGLLDVIEVRLAHGYDIGIASRWSYQTLALQPAQWADRVAAGVAD
jgi:uncharacterized RDD family membrane protein YckC